MESWHRKEVLQLCSSYEMIESATNESHFKLKLDVWRAFGLRNLQLCYSHQVQTYTIYEPCNEILRKLLPLTHHLSAASLSLSVRASSMHRKSAHNVRTICVFDRNDKSIAISCPPSACDLCVYELWPNQVIYKSERRNWFENKLIGFAVKRKFA